jgi:hypothetical protein
MYRYYIVGIRMASIYTSTPGELEVDFIVEHTRKEMRAAEHAKSMVENVLWPTTHREAIHSVGLDELGGFFKVLPYMVRANNLMVIKLETKNLKLTREDISMYVKTAPIEELRKAMIHV